MKKFIFPLQALLNARMLQEKEAKKNLVQAEQQLQKEEEKLQKACQAETQAKGTFQTRVRQGSGSQALLQDLNIIRACQEAVRDQRAAVATAKQARNHCREQLQLIFTEIKSLEKLRDQQLAACRAAEAREQDLAIDEFVSYNIQQAIQLNGQA
jgi:flagellar export protein FliJ